MTLEETIQAALLAELSLLVSEMVEKTKQLRAIVMATSLETPIDQGFLVEKNSDAIFYKIPKSDHEEQVDSADDMNSSISRESTK